MGERLIESLVTVAVALIGVATLAVIVSKQANTTSVISSAGKAFAQDLGTAVSPITGNNGLALSGINPSELSIN